MGKCFDDATLILEMQTPRVATISRSSFQIFVFCQMLCRKKNAKQYIYCRTHLPLISSNLFPNNKFCLLIMMICERPHRCGRKYQLRVEQSACSAPSSLANSVAQKLKSESREITSRYIALSRWDTRERNTNGVVNFA